MSVKKAKWKQYPIFAGTLPKVIFGHFKCFGNTKPRPLIRCKIDENNNEIIIDRRSSAYKFLFNRYMEFRANPNGPSDLIYDIPEGVDESTALLMVQSFTDRAATFAIHDYVSDMHFLEFKTNCEAQQFLVNGLNEATIRIIIIRAARCPTIWERKRECKKALREIQIANKIAESLGRTSRSTH